jgi:excisionase family DNA binding protein
MPRAEGALQDVAQAQRTLGEISRPTLYRLIRNGELAVVKIGSRTLFRPEDLRDFIDRHVQRVPERRQVAQVDHRWWDTRHHRASFARNTRGGDYKERARR